MTQTARPAPSNGRLDWRGIRDSVDLAAVATGLLGPAPGRRGGKGRHWWHCPLGAHEDRNPSFTILSGGRRWKCFGCGESGDAAALVMKVTACDFRDAIAYLGSDQPTKVQNLVQYLVQYRPRPPRRGGGILDLAPSGLPESDAAALVEAAEARLWTPEGAEALAYLTGRGLTEATIRSARLGWTPRETIPRASGDSGYLALGVVVPWFLDDRLAVVKLRQPDGRRPKYAEAFRHPGRLVCYPGPAAVSSDLPLVVAEGEFDTLLLAQELAGLASVVTLGSASAKPSAVALDAMLASATWFVATDADAAGDASASTWPARARRVRPPVLRPHPNDPDAAKPKTDWTDLHLHGVSLRRWWSDVLAGRPDPPLFVWSELAAMRWGPAAECVDLEAAPAD